jgi:hypothetical protein
MSTTIYASKTLAATPEFDATAVRISGAWYSTQFIVTLTNGSIPPYAGRQITLNYLITDTDLGATPSVTGLASTGRAVVVTDGIASSVKKTSITVPTRDQDSISYSYSSSVTAGQYLYVWVNHDDLGQPVNLAAIGDSIQTSGVVFDADANVRFVTGKGLQLYDKDTGLWHTVLCTGTSPAISLEQGQS